MHVVTAGPAIIRLAAKAPSAVVKSAPSATFAPARKRYPKDEYGAAISAWVESEQMTADEFVVQCMSDAEVAGASITLVISESAIAHNPEQGIYSDIVSVDYLLAGLRIIAAKVVVVA